MPPRLAGAWVTASSSCHLDWVLATQPELASFLFLCGFNNCPSRLNLTWLLSQSGPHYQGIAEFFCWDLLPVGLYSEKLQQETPPYTEGQVLFIAFPLLPSSPPPLPSSHLPASPWLAALSSSVVPLKGLCLSHPLLPTASTPAQS